MVHPADMDLWAERIHLAYPTFNWPPICFGYDWMGRTFALQSGRSEDGLPGVLMFDLGGGDAFSIPANIISFHDSEIIKSPDAALDASFYHSWRAAGSAAPAYDQCIGYRVPLFLGGEDGISNLEASDLDVYWSIFGQVPRQSRASKDAEADGHSSAQWSRAVHRPALT